MCQRFRLCSFIAAALLLAPLAVAPAAHGFDGEIHQQLTFTAARQLNRCLDLQGSQQQVSALEVRYIAKANVRQADGGVFTRMFRWDYYDREEQAERSVLGIIDTRLHEHFNELVERIEQPLEQERQLRELGRLLNYLQDVSAPAHVVPVFTGRWWRFSMSDRFDRFPVDMARLSLVLEDYCNLVLQEPESYQLLLQSGADQTLVAVAGEITGFPATWQSFWEPSEDEGDFGSYGPAGNNFGDRTEFRCGSDEERQRCLLLENDPLYADFAHVQHLAATLRTMRALWFYMATMDAEEPEDPADSEEQE